MRQQKAVLTCPRGCFVLTSLLFFFQMIFQTRILTETTWSHCDSSESTGATICIRCAAEILVSDYLNGILVSLDCCIFLCTCFVFGMQSEGTDFFFFVCKNWKVQTCWPSQDKLKAHFSCYVHLPHLKVLGQHDLWYWNEHKAVKFTGSKCHNLKKKLIEFQLCPVAPSQTSKRNTTSEFAMNSSSEQLYYNSVQYIEELNDWRSAGFNLHPIILCAFGNICF